jgi:acid stress-induced BolA-like protein IbaG/YrbA
METIMKRIQKALEHGFSSKEIILEPVWGKMIAGWVISKSFEGLTGMERQKKVRRLFNEYLSEKDISRLGIFLTFTPSEKKRVFDDDLDEFELSDMKRTSSTRGKKPMVARRNNGAMGRKTPRKSKQTAAAR